MRIIKAPKNMRLTREEKDFNCFSRHFDHEVYYLELDYNLTPLVRDAVRNHLQQKQEAFDRMMASHPATIADEKRRRERFRLELQHLGRKWHAKVVA